MTHVRLENDSGGALVREESAGRAGCALATSHLRRELDLCFGRAAYSLLPDDGPGRWVHTEGEGEGPGLTDHGRISSVRYR